MSMKCISPYPPEPSLLYRKTGICRGIPIFLIFAQNTDCVTGNFHFLGSSYMYPQSMFCAKISKYQNFSAENFQFLKLKKSLFIARACFCNERHKGN